MLGGFDGRLSRAKGGHQDHRQAGLHRMELADEFKPIDSGHPEIRDDQREVFVRRQREAFVAAMTERDGVAL